MVMENSDIGPLLAIGIKSRKKDHLVEGFITMYNTLKKAGINPILHRVDNEFSTDLINKKVASGLKYQANRASRQHRTLPIEKAI